LSGVIKFNKALKLFKDKFGEDYSNLDIYDEFLLSNELDLFIYINATVCECLQNGSGNDKFYVKKLYPYFGYARIVLDERVKKLLIGSVKSINISEITGIYNSKGSVPSQIIAQLYDSELDCDYYNSLNDIEISEINSKESVRVLSINTDHLFFSRKQIADIGLSNNVSINLNISEPEKNWHTKEKRSIGLIIATLASLNKKIDISDPYSESLDIKLLQEIKKLDPESKGISPNTLGKFLQFANDALK
jgi:hypothetical protein